jgi:regulator of RNase E activity RraA
VFQDLDDPSVAATFGEVMCTVYQSFGAAGIITSGAGRDLDQVRALDFPAFTGGTICSHGYSHIPDVGVPVHIGGLMVYPNDLLPGDCNGVTNIPTGIPAEVADIGDAFVAAEGIILDALRQGTSSIKLLQEARAESHRRIEQLRSQVARVK